MSQKVNQQIPDLAFKAGWSKDIVLLRDAEVRDLVGVSVNGSPPHFRSAETLQKAMLVRAHCGGCGIVAVVEHWSSREREDVRPVFILEYQVLEAAGPAAQMSIHQAILGRDLGDLRTHCLVHRAIPLDSNSLLNAAGKALADWPDPDS